jgi:hypothetical protein
MSRVRRQHVKCASVTLVPAKLIARNFVEEHRQMPVVIRIACAVLIAFLAVVTGAAAQTSAKGPVTVFDFTFPEEIAGAQRTSFRDYESNQPGLGYSAGYKQGNLIGTVYIYDDRKQSIPDDPQSPLVKAQLEQSRTELVGLWHGVGVRVDLKEDFTIEDARGRTRLICAAFAITGDDGRPRDSFSCLGVAKNKFLKFRISGVSQAEARRFVNAWIDLLWPPS